MFGLFVTERVVAKTPKKRGARPPPPPQSLPNECAHRRCVSPLCMFCYAVETLVIGLIEGSKRRLWNQRRSHQASYSVGAMVYGLLIGDIRTPRTAIKGHSTFTRVLALRQLCAAPLAPLASGHQPDPCRTPNAAH
jgi:hypothetical protein